MSQYFYKGETMSDAERLKQCREMQLNKYLDELDNCCYDEEYDNYLLDKADEDRDMEREYNGEE